MFFRKKETNKEIADRLWELTDKKEYGVFPPPMDAQVALNELCNYFLGDEWYAISPISQEQINTEIVYEIECKLKKYKAENMNERRM